MSSQTIEMHFKETMEAADRLKELAKELSDAAQKDMLQIICSVKADWNSECADILVGKEVKVASSLAQEAVKLHTLALEVESKARIMYQSEMNSTRLALIRIY